jgi:hypothetical protein
MAKLKAAVSVLSVVGLFMAVLGGTAYVLRVSPYEIWPLTLFTLS